MSAGNGQIGQGQDSSENEQDGNKSPSSKIFTRHDYTVGWVCALHSELTAAKAMLDELHPTLSTPPTDHNVYNFGSVGNHKVVIACLPKSKYGIASAAVVAAQMIDSFPGIKFGFMIGIGGGIPSKKHDIRLGDVVVSTPINQFPGVVQWDFGKARDGGSFERIGALTNPPRELLTALTNLETKHTMEESEMSNYLRGVDRKWPKVARYTNSNSLKDILFASNYPHRTERQWPALFSAVFSAMYVLVTYLLCWWAFSPTERGAGPAGSTTAGKDLDEQQKSSTEADEDEDEDKCQFCGSSGIIKRRTRSTMRIHYGLIASGNQVIKDAAFRDRLNRDLGGDVLCVEMEAAGLMETFPCLIIRGICDYADSHKNKDWQRYAAFVAAVYAKELLLIIPSRAMEEMVAIKRIDKRLEEISQDMRTVRQSQLSQDQKAILDWLTPVNFTPQQHEYFNRRCPGTGQWFLKSEGFQDFLRCRGQTLLCEGFPGAGKTILASIVVDHLQHNYRDSLNGDAENEKIGLAFIYYEFAKHKEQSPTHILASLIKQLVQGQPSIPEPVRELYDKFKDKSASSSSKIGVQELTKTLEYVISGIYTRVFIVIDALDECENTEAILPGIKSVVNTTQANLFATSRPHWDIQRQLKQGLRLSIEAKDNDVKQYINSRIPELKILRDENRDLSDAIKTQLKTEIRDRVSEAVDGIFLLARFHLDSLIGSTRPSMIRQTLQELPKGPSAYGRTYEKTIKRIGAQELRLRLLARRVLQWLICAETQLSTQDLRYALSTEFGSISPPDEDDLESTITIIDICMGLVTIEEEIGVVRLLHYTTLEYLQANMGCLSYLEDPEIRKKDTMIFAKEAERAMTAAQSDIAKICVTYLSYTVSGIWPYQEFVQQSDRKFGQRSRVQFRQRSCRPPEGFLVQYRKGMQRHPFLPYAAVHWGHHAYRASREGEMPADLHTSILRLMESDIRVTSLAIVQAERGERLDLVKKTTGAHLAAQFGLCGATMALLKGNNLDLEDGYQRTPLWIATRHGHEGLASVLLKAGANPSWIAGHGDEQTPLSNAAEHGHKAIVKLLINEGVDLNLKNRYGQTALFHATEAGHEDIVKLLIQKGANPNLQDTLGKTPLLSAATYGHEAITSILLREGANPNSIDKSEYSPLSLAAENGYEAIVRQLLDKNANPNSTDGNGQSPLLLAAKNGHEAIVIQLLEKNANPSSTDKDGRSPLWYAARGGHEAIVELMLELGVDPNVEAKDFSYENHTPLSLAVRNGNEAVVKLLLQYGADPNAEGKKLREGRTPLSFAAENVHKTVVELLLSEIGTWINSVDKTFMTPYHRALIEGHKQVAEILRRHGGGLFGKEKYLDTVCQNTNPQLQDALAPTQSIVHPLVERNAVRLQGNDDAVREVEIEIIKKSALIKNLLEFPNDESVVPQGPIFIPHANKEVLEKVIEWCRHHQDNSGLGPDEDVEEGRIQRSRNIDEWDQNFMRVDQDVLISILMTAHYLSITALDKLAFRTVAQMIRNPAPNSEES